jgi:type II secretory pathway component PulC
MKLQNLYNRVRSVSSRSAGLVASTPGLVKKIRDKASSAMELSKSENRKALFSQTFKLQSLHFDTLTRPDTLIRWLWRLNIVIITITCIILLLGLTLYFLNRPASVKGGQQPDDAQTDDKKQLADGDKKLDSPIVAMARQYSKHLEDGGKPKPPTKQPGPIAKAPPTEPPKPAPAPQPVVSKPKPTVNFSLKATLLIGNDDGLAWVLLPGKSEPQAFAKGEKIEQYKITQIKHGQIVVERDGVSQTLKVPEPPPGSTLAIAPPGQPEPATPPGTPAAQAQIPPQVNGAPAPKPGSPANLRDIRRRPRPSQIVR